MIHITGKEDLEALHHITTLESITDQAIKEAEEQKSVAAKVIEAFAWKDAEARRYQRAFLMASGIAGFWFAAAMFWMWRAVR